MFASPNSLFQFTVGMETFKTAESAFSTCRRDLEGAIWQREWVWWVWLPVMRGGGEEVCDVSHPEGVGRVSESCEVTQRRVW